MLLFLNRQQKLVFSMYRSSLLCINIMKLYMRHKCHAAQSIIYMYVYLLNRTCPILSYSLLTCNTCQIWDTHDSCHKWPLNEAPPYLSWQVSCLYCATHHIIPVLISNYEYTLLTFMILPFVLYWAHCSDDSMTAMYNWLMYSIRYNTEVHAVYIDQV